ncbi:hypothetical protein M413DRAFT_421331 [Hebeloma cylindrosporum]|uniref:Uncharacterized protein n=1 Tax=Hebeloma cylindrosporum TaxID=76867 RepID=A0A0C2XIU3_HEBCY|nr:hypothetical protein M413DRAFT_421331 [Hebeloma cylindrosporum h7]
MLVEDVEFPDSGIRGTLTMPAELDTSFEDLSHSDSSSCSWEHACAPSSPKAPQTRPFRIIEEAPLATGVKIKIPAPKLLQTSSNINIDTPSLSATSLIARPQKLTIIIPPMAKLSKAGSPLLPVDTPQTPATSAEFPVSIKIKIPRLNSLALDQNARPGVSSPNNMEPPSHASSGTARPRRIAPLPKRYMQLDT